MNNDNTTKHTPGPWVAHNDGYQWQVNDAAHTEITATGIETEANARLIASAPELLIAAAGALAALSQNKTFPADIDAAKKWLSDAIAKATGQ